MQDSPKLLIVRVCCLAFWLIWQHRARAAAAKAKEQREARWLLRLAQQRRIQERLLTIHEESLGLLHSMPGWVESAEKHLDWAEADFAEGAFAPFWTSIEGAALSLAAFYQSVQRLESHSCEYVDLRPQCRAQVPAFPLSSGSTAKMKLATATSHRMHGIVRRAQRDFQFSVIYEHRHTNQILVAGFRNLAQAVDEMASRIAESIDSLTTSIDRMTATLDESLRHLTGQPGRLAATGGSGDAGESGREQQGFRVLDGIEQERYPGAIRWV
jgi:hypothetical protein